MTLGWIAMHCANSARIQVELRNASFIRKSDFTTVRCPTHHSAGHSSQLRSVVDPNATLLREVVHFEAALPPVREVLTRGRANSVNPLAVAKDLNATWQPTTLGIGRDR